MYGSSILCISFLKSVLNKTHTFVTSLLVTISNYASLLQRRARTETLAVTLVVNRTGVCGSVKICGQV